jgi:hypothetical protein
MYTTAFDTIAQPTFPATARGVLAGMVAPGRCEWPNRCPGAPPRRVIAAVRPSIGRTRNTIRPSRAWPG